MAIHTVFHLTYSIRNQGDDVALNQERTEDKHNVLSILDSKPIVLENLDG